MHKRDEAEAKFHKGKPKKKKGKKARPNSPLSSQDGKFSMSRRGRVADKPNAARRRRSRTGPRTT